MDKIILKNMSFFGYHGAIAEENTLGQRFYVDVILYLPLQSSGLNDDLSQTIHYGEAYELIKGIVEGKPYKLIEAVAEQISIVLLGEYPLLQEVEIQIRKPSAPIQGILDYSAVEIRRKRDV